MQRWLTCVLAAGVFCAPAFASLDCHAPDSIQSACCPDVDLSCCTATSCGDCCYESSDTSAPIALPQATLMPSDPLLADRTALATSLPARSWSESAKRLVRIVGPPPLRTGQRLGELQCRLN